MFENFNDGYHANRLHEADSGLLPERARRLPGRGTTTSNAIVRTNGFTHIDGGFNATRKALMPILPGLTEEERWRVTFALVPPTLCLGFAPDEVFYFLVDPESAESISIDIGYCFHPEAVKHPLFEILFEESQEGVKIFNARTSTPTRWCSAVSVRGSRFVGGTPARRRPTASSTGGWSGATGVTGPPRRRWTGERVLG